MTTDNLLVKLHGWATQQSENFTTESFAHVLEHLMRARPRAAVRFLNWLTDGRVTVDESDVHEFEVRRQPGAGPHGRPDLLIEGPDVAVIVEVKLGGDLGNSQASAYLCALAKLPQTRRVLVGITGQAPPAALPPEMVLRLWRDVAVELQRESEAACGDGGDAVVTDHELTQFVGFLSHLRLLPPPRVATTLADALDAYAAEIAATPGSTSVFDSRIRSLTKLDSSQSLAPVRHLLEQMREALARGGHAARLESGRFGQWPWIGYTTEGLRYVLDVNLREPQRVTLMRYAGGVTRNSFASAAPSLGKVNRIEGLLRWSNELDLAKAGYFNQTAAGQLDLLARFIDTSVAFAEKLRVAGTSAE